MPTFDRYDVVSVPFPYTDRATLARRPALVVSQPGLERRLGLLWVLMITAAENRAWDDDIAIPDHQGAGLPIPSIIRPTKIATVEARRARFRGRIPSSIAAAVAAAIKSIIP
jgi:mRNA interferase MazF